MDQDESIRLAVEEFNVEVSHILFGFPRMERYQTYIEDRNSFSYQMLIHEGFIQFGNPLQRVYHSLRYLLV